MTPIKVRGKRNAAKAQKLNTGKQRKEIRTGSTTPSEAGHSARSDTPDGKSALRRRQPKRQHRELSRLEELPTEVLQSIFEWSANIDLPLTSPRLASQLASPHLFTQLTSQIVEPVLGGTRTKGGELAAAMRLTNSKFFTWSFFRSWLHAEFERLNLLQEWQDVTGSDGAIIDPEREAEWTWYKLRPHISLVPPTKLLRGPFTRDKVRFLRFISSSFQDEPEQLDPMYVERAKEGLQQAVSEGVGDALPAFWNLGMQPDTELLRSAVIDSGCKQEVVSRLVARVVHLASEPIDVDFLDPALWSWADKARSKGNENGTWLMSLLKGAARSSGRKEREIQQVKTSVD